MFFRQQPNTHANKTKISPLRRSQSETFEYHKTIEDSLSTGKVEELFSLAKCLYIMVNFV